MMPAAWMVSSWQLRTGISTASTCMSGDMAFMARSTMPYASGMCSTRRTPALSSPNSRRRTMRTFSWLSKTLPCATRRRMSLPEEGLASIAAVFSTLCSMRSTDR